MAIEKRCNLDKTRSTKAKGGITHETNKNLKTSGLKLLIVRLKKLRG